MKVNKNIYFARYEQFNDNFELLFNHFEEFFQIVIVKDYRGQIYAPEWGFNGIGNMVPGEAYQVKFKNM